MPSPPHLARIFLYPLKALDPLEVSQADILASGALAHDRRYALLDDQGKFINGKRNVKVHSLRSQFNLATASVTLSCPPYATAQTFHWPTDKLAMEEWLSQYFAQPVGLAENPELGFPDDTDSPGPTVISTATIATVATWFPGLTATEIRLRLRANLEIDGVPAFWEDQLFGTAGQKKTFTIGAVQFYGINPCQRCIVPTRHSQTGEGYPNFQKIFMEQRQRTFPNEVERSQFNHFYRLSVNTQIPTSEAGKTLRVGDRIVFPDLLTQP